jgi:hemin uptake protein HemP
MNRDPSDGNARQPLNLPAAKAVPRIKVLDLLGSAREAILELNDAEYRLRITAAGKLILTK